jgi:hypothetical protein
MEDTREQPQPKSNISTTTWVLVFIVCVLFDLLSLIPFVGDIEDVPAGVILVLNLVLGVGAVILIVQGIVMVLKAIPVVQEFPLWTIGAIAAFIAEKIPALKPVVQVAEKYTELESGGAGAAGKAGAAAEGAAAKTGAAGAEGVATQAGGAATAGVQNAESGGAGTQRTAQTAPATGEAPEQKPTGGGSTALNEVGGNAMGNLQEELLEPPQNNIEPSAPTPFQNDAPTPSPEAPSSGERKGIHLVKSGLGAAQDHKQNSRQSDSSGNEEEEELAA